MRYLKNSDDAKKLFNIISKVGFLLLKSGAEAKRIEETIVRMGTAIEGFCYVNCFAQYTAVYVTIDYQGEKLTTMERYEDPSMNFTVINKVNQLSREFCSKKISLDEAVLRLEEIERLRFNEILRPIGSGIVSGCFTLMFGGGPLDFIASVIIGFVSWYILFNIDMALPQFFIDLFSGMIVSAMALLFIRIGLGRDLDMIMIGVIMPYVPGTLITSGIRDTLVGHHLTGTMMIIKAIFTAFAIALGALIPLYTTL